MKISFAAPVVLSLLACLAPNSAVGKSKYSYDARFDARVASHIGSVGGLASDRLDLGFEQDAAFSQQFSAALGVSSWLEGVYNTRPDIYNSQVAQNDGQDLRFKNVFLPYQSGPFFLKVGNQQVAWAKLSATRRATS